MSLPPVPEALDWRGLAPRAEAALNVAARFHAAADVPAKPRPPGTPAHGAAAFLDALADLDARFLARMPRVGSDPKWLASEPVAASPAAVLGELLAYSINQPSFAWITSPIATELEAVVMDALVAALGLPEHTFCWSGGVGGAALHASAAEALTVALLAAREDARKREPAAFTRGAVYCADRAPAYVEKAATVVGVPHVRRVASLPSGGLDAVALRAAVAADRAAGLVPLAVVACVASRDDGGIDDVAAAVAVARDGAAPMHAVVDTGHAGIAACCPEHRELFRGWAEADAIVVNTGAWLPAGLDCTMLAFRARAPVVSSLNATGAYLANEHTACGTVIDFKDYHLGLGRQFRSIRLYAALQAIGLDGVRALVWRHTALCGLLRARLAAHGVQPGRLLELPAYLGVVGVRCAAAGAVADELRRSAGVAVGVAADGSALRLAVSALGTTAADVEAVAAAVARAMATLSPADATAPAEPAAPCAEPELPGVPAAAVDWAGLERGGLALCEQIADVMHEMCRRDPDTGLSTSETPAVASVAPNFIKGLLLSLAPSDDADESLSTDARVARVVAPAAPACLPGDAFAPIVALFRSVVLPGTNHWQHPRYYHFFPALSSPSALLGAALMIAVNQPGRTVSEGAALTKLETETASRWLPLLGLPDDFTVLHQPTATEAVLAAQAAARDAKLSALHPGDSEDARAARVATREKLAAYICTDAHFATEKAARILGVPHVRSVPGRRVGDNSTMDIDALTAAIAADEAAGLVPFFVSGSIGATGTCSMDDVASLRYVADKHGMWLNVDAAYAGTAATVGEVRSIEYPSCAWTSVPGSGETVAPFKAWASADSIEVNASKWVPAGFNSNLFYIRKPELVVKALTGMDVADDLQSTHLCNTQTARGVRMHLVLAEMGATREALARDPHAPNGFQPTIARHNELAARLADKLRAVEVDGMRFAVADARLGLVCFDASAFNTEKTPNMNDALAEAVCADHNAFLGTGASYIRVSLSHPSTSEADMDALVASFERCLKVLRA